MTKPVAWVAGGAAGLGVQIAHCLAEEGYRIAVNYRTSEGKAETLVSELQRRGTDALALQGDMGLGANVQAMAAAIVDRWHRIDVLVYTAGPFLKKQLPLWQIQTDEWDSMIRNNLSGVYYAVKAVMPHMVKHKFGRIVTFGFPNVDHAPAWEGFGAYAAAKAGLASVTKTLAREAAPYGVTVNMICPGDIRQPYKELPIEASRGHTSADHPVGRPGTGGDIGRVVQFLVHPDADFITGSVIEVSGGFDPRTFQLPGQPKP